MPAPPTPLLDLIRSAPARRPLGPIIRFAALVLLVAGLGALTMAVGPDREGLRAAAAASQYAPAAAVLGSALLVAALVPRTLLAVVGGALFGTVTGSLYVLVGITAGAALSYGVGRLLGREFVSSRIRGRLAHAEAALSRHGIWAVVVCRLIPLVPFAISNYAFGTTSVRPRQLIVGTLLGALPATLAYAALGSATVQQDWFGAKVAGGCALALGCIGMIGTYLVWRHRPGPATSGLRSEAPRPAASGLRSVATREDDAVKGPGPRERRRAH